VWQNGNNKLHISKPHETTFVVGEENKTQTREGNVTVMFSIYKEDNCLDKEPLAYTFPLYK
jgi:hypothetical protein